MAVVKRDELNTLTTASAKAVAAIKAGEHHVDGTLWFYDELRLMAGELSLTVAAHTLRHADIYAAQVSPPTPPADGSDCRLQEPPGPVGTSDTERTEQAVTGRTGTGNPYDSQRPSRVTAPP